MGLAPTERSRRRTPWRYGHSVDPDLAISVSLSWPAIVGCRLQITGVLGYFEELSMSIPRFAIERPVMMAMISAIVVLLGAISLTRLPVDLLPDIQQPTVNVRMNYTGVGPLEMEELVTRPLEQALSAVAGLDMLTSEVREGNTQVRLNFAWGTDLGEAMDDIRMRIDRVRNRLPEDADPPILNKFDPSQMPILRIAVEGNYDRVILREMAENILSPRFERVIGVALGNG